MTINIKPSRVLAFGLGLALCGLLFSQAKRGPVFDSNAPANLSVYEIDRAYITSTPTDVVTGNIWLTEVVLSNVTSSNVTCTVLDKQGSPLPLYNNIIPPGLASWRFEAMKMPGGVTWSCATDNAVIGSLRGKRIGN